jgi:hypothetical protein
VYNYTITGYEHLEQITTAKIRIARDGAKIKTESLNLTKVLIEQIEHEINHE